MTDTPEWIELDVTSVAGEGTFTIRLPIAGISPRRPDLDTWGFRAIHQA